MDARVRFLSTLYRLQQQSGYCCVLSYASTIMFESPQSGTRPWDAKTLTHLLLLSPLAYGST